MSSSGRFTVKFRRKREGKTNYNKRLRMLLSGKPRLVIRKSLSNIYAQIVIYQKGGDSVLVSANSTELESHGWKLGCGNIPAAYLVGLLVAKKASKKSLNHAICDIGLFPSSKGSRLYAALKGAIDGGLDVPHSDGILPDEKRLNGSHIADYAKANNKPELAGITAQFDAAKANILKL